MLLTNLQPSKLLQRQLTKSLFLNRDLWKYLSFLRRRSESLSEKTQSQQTSQLISTKQAAQIIGCSIDSFKGYLSKGVFQPSKKVSGKNFYCEKTIRNFVLPSRVKKSKPISNKSSTVDSIDIVDMRDIIKRWQTSPQDNASCDVEIGVYTEKIQRLEIDMHGVDKETKEFLSMRALLVRYVFARRKLLNYLQKAHFGRYLKAMRMINSKA